MKKLTIIFIGILILNACSNDGDNSVEKELLPVTAEMLIFDYTSDTGNNTARLHYEIKFSNPNDVAIQGFYRITFDSDGLVITALSTNFSECYEIPANSECIHRYEGEDSLDLITPANAVQFISAEYNIEE